MSQLSELDIDALKEVANIGTGHASIAFSAIFNKKIDLGLPESNIIEVNELEKYLSKIKFSNNNNNNNNNDSNNNIASLTLVGTSSHIKEGIDGTILLLFEPDNAYKISSLIKYGESHISNIKMNDNSLSAEDIQILTKLSSVVYRKYLTSVANLFEKQIIFETPRFISANGTDLSDFAGITMNENEKILLITMNVGINELNINSIMVLLFKIDSVESMINILKSKLGM